jgi:hypothetical protein
VLEAYKLLKANNCLPDIYQFTEELPYSDAALSEMVQIVLFDAVKAMGSQELHIGLYTCEPLMLLIGSYKSSIFILDTHPVPVSFWGSLHRYFEDFQWIGDRSFRGMMHLVETADSVVWKMQRESTIA